MIIDWQARVRTHSVSLTEGLDVEKGEDLFTLKKLEGRDIALAIVLVCNQERLNLSKSLTLDNFAENTGSHIEFVRLALEEM